MTEKAPQLAEEKPLGEGMLGGGASSDTTGKVFFRIGDVARILGVSPSVIRYWEMEFKNIKPSRSRSGQRLYRRKDLEHLQSIKRLIYEERLTIEGAKMHMAKKHEDALLRSVLDRDLLQRIIQGLEAIKRIASEK
ncbi:MAG: MerR family transcriptional regulator [Deltaproteobacteria bacterium]|nr:MerR family transcriptional regulator [Deltaproteobacteria bacterium]